VLEEMQGAEPCTHTGEISTLTILLIAPLLMWIVTNTGLIEQQQQDNDTRFHTISDVTAGRKS